MQVFLRTLEGDSRALRVDESLSVAGLKLLIEVRQTLAESGCSGQGARLGEAHTARTVWEGHTRPSGAHRSPGSSHRLWCNRSVSI